jgi:hypothetical protein
MSDRVVKIGGACGAWGDSPMGTPQLLGADVHYLVMDYLAEVTMSLLARARLKDPEAGFPPDFVLYLKPHLAALALRGVKVVSNAGGVNPQACKRALEALIELAGLPLRVAVVEGDDLMPLIDELRGKGTREWVSGEALPAKLLTANAYLGAVPIAAALAGGADIVITGRCADSALALGVLMHEFGWSPAQHDLLAAGSLVGHLLECGPQACGGTFTDWDTVPGWAEIGYPIAECRADGSFVLTKPDGTGGLVTPATVAEQVLYETGDPAAYMLPDVVADFSQVTLSQDGNHRVAVRGARGRPPSDSYKVSATYQDGYRAVGMLAIVGVDAAAKARRVAEALVERTRSRLAERGLPPLRAERTEVLGAESAYGSASRAMGTREVVLRLVVEHADAKALDLFARELGSAGLGFAPGITGLIGGRPKPTPVVRLYTFLVPKAWLPAPRVSLGAQVPCHVPIATHGGFQPPASEPTLPGAVASKASDTAEIDLRQIAHARSGDKGNTSNIAIFFRRPEYVAHMRDELTPARIAEHFSDCVDGPVTRFEAPGLHAFNFVLDNALGGGGMASLRLDAQGKAHGQRALEMRVSVPKAWLADLLPVPTTVPAGAPAAGGRAA